MQLLEKKKIKKSLFFFFFLGQSKVGRGLGELEKPKLEIRRAPQGSFSLIWNFSGAGVYLPAGQGEGGASSAFSLLHLISLKMDPWAPQKCSWPGMHLQREEGGKGRSIFLFFFGMKLPPARNISWLKEHRVKLCRCQRAGKGKKKPLIFYADGNLGSWRELLRLESSQEVGVNTLVLD